MTIIKWEPRMLGRLWLLVLASGLLTGCTSLAASKAPGADLSRLQTFYVAKLPADERGIEKIIATYLNSKGLRATSGPEPTPAEPVDAIVTYQDRWTWHITMFMTRLNVQIRDAKTGMILANGESYRPSLLRKSPKGLVDQVFTEMFEQ